MQRLSDTLTGGLSSSPPPPSASSLAPSLAPRPGGGGLFGERARGLSQWLHSLRLLRSKWEQHGRARAMTAGRAARLPVLSVRSTDNNCHLALSRLPPDAPGGAAAAAAAARARAKTKASSSSASSSASSASAPASPSRHVVAVVSSGTAGFTGARKSSAYAAEAAGLAMASKCIEHDCRAVRVRLSGLGMHRRAIVKGLRAGGVELLSIEETTNVPFNGCRPPSKRRL